MGRKTHQIGIKNHYRRLNITTLLLITGWLLIVCNSGFAQNLIPNGDFETWHDTTNFRLFHDENYHPYIADWFTNTQRVNGKLGLVLIDNNSPMSINFKNLNNLRVFDGKGVGRVGQTITNHPNPSTTINMKHFLQNKLLDTLASGCYYKFDVYILPEYKKGIPEFFAYSDWLTSDRLGFYFSDQRPEDTTSLPIEMFNSYHIKPQVVIPPGTFITDTVNFTHLTHTFTADGGEQYITIGNFYSLDSTQLWNINTGQYFFLAQHNNFHSEALFFLDDLSLTLVPPPDSIFTTIGDTTICAGTPLTLYASGQHAQWYVWSTGGTDSTATITQPGTYWVECGFNCGFTKTDTIVVTLAPDNPPTIPNQDTTLCPGEQAILYNPWPDAAQLLWSNGSTDSTLTTSLPGIYWLQATTLCGHTRTDTMYISPPENLPYIPAPQDTTLCAGDYYTIDLPPGLQYALNGVPQNSHLITLNQDGRYTLKAQNQCFEQFFTFYIETEECQTKLWVPNAFTPNGDGTNDCFAPVISNYTEGSYQIYITDRWGNVFFSSTNPEECWDGSRSGTVIQGAYNYRILYRDNKNKYHEKLGTVVVLP